MKARIIPRTLLLAMVALAVGAGIISVHAQNSGKWTPPRTPWGDPDLQGLWPGTESLGIPLQRDPKLETRNELTEQEFEDRRRQAQQAVDDMEAEFDLASADTSKAGQVGSATSPPPHWQERGTPSRQAWLIVDPRDGRMPPLTSQARARYDAIQAARKNRGRRNWSRISSLDDRCISRGVIGSVLPVIYNNGNEIVQAPGYVVIRNEMIHESRIDPLDGRPHLNSGLHLWMGDPRGHWEGDTLVVETRQT